MKFLKSILPILIVSTGLLIAIEIVARCTLSKIYNRSFDKALLEAHKYGDTDGLKANATGMVWGKGFHTDEMGGRLQPKTKNKKNKIFYIGDSVTEGVGVDDSCTFAYQTDKDADSLYEVRNISLIGWSSADYKNVVNNLLTDKCDSNNTAIFLFYCLNDIYGKAKTKDLPTMCNKCIISSINSVLQQRYATYKLLKLWIYNNSDYYYQYDAKLYTDTSKVNQVVADLSAIATTCAHHGVNFGLIILPYRSQLKNEKANYPQQVLKGQIQAHHIPCFDLLGDLANQSNIDSLYLYADEIHFSAKGHKAIAKLLIGFNDKRGL